MAPPAPPPELGALAAFSFGLAESTTFVSATTTRPEMLSYSLAIEKAIAARFQELEARLSRQHQYLNDLRDHSESANPRAEMERKLGKVAERFTKNLEDYAKTTDVSDALKKLPDAAEAVKTDALRLRAEFVENMPGPISDVLGGGPAEGQR